uniref:Uncharacterized protein n=1 Tax=Cacopsylla melanoneura TaxID=428564 RepID=A0A8D8UPV1_9HEMI
MRKKRNPAAPPCTRLPLRPRRRIAEVYLKRRRRSVRTTRVQFKTRRSLSVELLVSRLRLSTKLSKRLRVSLRKRQRNPADITLALGHHRLTPPLLRRNPNQLRLHSVRSRSSSLTRTTAQVRLIPSVPAPKQSHHQRQQRTLAERKRTRLKSR